MFFVRKLWPVLAAMLFGLLGPVVAQQGTQDFPLTTEETSVGLVWADEKGMTLYVYLLDGQEAATCTGVCTGQWPPHEASARHRQFPPAGFSVITHPDGLLQWAYMNQPLYRSAEDAQPREIRGHGEGDAWWVAVPQERHLDLQVPGVSAP